MSDKAGVNEGKVSTERAAGLRERRHQRTARDLRDAALVLFERQGYARTTVEQIALEAGVSPRTFFRYCPAKEDALLLDAGGTEEQMQAAIATVHPGEDLLTALENAIEDTMERIEEAPDDRDRTVRLRRVMLSEPALIAASLREESARNSRLVSAIEQAGVADTRTATATILILSAEMRLATDHWTRDRTLSLADHFRASQALMRAVTAGSPATTAMPTRSS